MNIVIYYNGLSSIDSVLLPSARGLNRAGYEVEVIDIKEGLIDCQVAITFGMKGRAQLVAHHQSKNLDKHIVIERGYLGDRVQKWFSVGYGGINGAADFKNTNSSPDRYEKNWSHLMKPWKLDGENIVIAGQTKQDYSLTSTDFDWEDYIEIVKKIKTANVKNRPVIFRHHPSCSRAEKVEIEKMLGESVLYDKNQFLTDTLKDTAVLVTHNSNSSVEAVMEGIQTISLHNTCMAYPVSRHEIESLETPLYAERNQWAYNLAYAQWSIEEIEQGECWKHLL